MSLSLAQGLLEQAAKLFLLLNIFEPAVEKGPEERLWKSFPVTSQA